MVGGWDEVSVEVGDFHGVEYEASTSSVYCYADFEVASGQGVGESYEHEGLLSWSAGLEDFVVDVVEDGVLGVGVGDAVFVRGVGELEPHTIMVVPILGWGKLRVRCVGVYPSTTPSMGPEHVA